MPDSEGLQFVYIGSDHGGWEYKERLKPFFKDLGYQVFDCGAKTLDTDDDYPLIAFSVAESVTARNGALGVLLCRSGSGMIIAANKVLGARATQLQTVEAATHAKKDNDANIIVFSADWQSIDEIKRIAKEFIDQSFSQEERHLRRIQQISDYEKRQRTS